MTVNRQIVVRELPKGALTQDHFELRTGEMPVVPEDGVVIRNILMSIDAANRTWMQGATYREAIKAGDVMHSYTIGEIIESNSDGFAVGDLVGAEAGWANYCAVSTRHLRKLPDMRPLTHLMSAYGVAGLTAHHGLMTVGKPVSGETVVVSAAAGSVGMFVGQIAKIAGCRAVGIAGGAEKCRWVVDELGFDACVDYRESGWHRVLKTECPDGIDVYFDNVGGQVLESVLFGMNEKGRVVCCGAVSQYDSANPVGPRNLPGMVVAKRLRMEGFIVFDFPDETPKALENLENWVRSGRIKVIEDVIEGLENAPTALIGLLAGENRGKRMVRVAPDP